MLKYKIRNSFFRKISYVYLKSSNFKGVNTVSQFKSIYKIFNRGEVESKKKIKRVWRSISGNMSKPTIKCS